MIDLAPMRAVAVDPGRRTALVQPGVLLGERDRALQSHRMIVPAGTVSHAGVAGLMLGGGFGRRSHELARSRCSAATSCLRSRGRARCCATWHGGAIARLAADATVFANRSASHNVIVRGSSPNTGRTSRG